MSTNELSTRGASTHHRYFAWWRRFCGRKPRRPSLQAGSASGAERRCLLLSAATYTLFVRVGSRVDHPPLRPPPLFSFLFSLRFTTRQTQYIAVPKAKPRLLWNEKSAAARQPQPPTRHRQQNHQHPRHQQQQQQQQEKHARTHAMRMRSHPRQDNKKVTATKIKKKTGTCSFCFVHRRLRFTCGGRGAPSLSSPPCPAPSLSPRPLPRPPLPPPPPAPLGIAREELALEGLARFARRRFDTGSSS